LSDIAANDPGFISRGPWVRVPPPPFITFDPAEIYFDGEGWKDRINASSLKELDGSPVAYYRRYVAKDAPERTGAQFDHGKLLHTWGELLVGTDASAFWSRVVTCPLHLTTATGQLGKAADSWLADQAPDAIPISPTTEKVLREQTKQILENPAAVDCLMAATHKEFNIAFEVDGLPCKCRVDGATPDFFYDFKTTRDADPDETFHRVCLDFKYELQAAFYLIGGMQAGWPRHRMQFIATSTTYPYHCAVMALPESVLQEAEARVYALLRELEQRRALNWWTPHYYGKVIEMNAKYFQKGRGW
jgi:hypothetical protein